MYKWCYKIPLWWPTAVVVCLILYATLNPNPVVISPKLYFSGIDKVIHFIMFFVFSGSLYFDWSKQSLPLKMTVRKVLIIAIISLSLGIVIEFLQTGMGLGRTGTAGDAAADALGAFAGAFVAFKAFKIIKL